MKEYRIRLNEKEIDTIYRSLLASHNDPYILIPYKILNRFKELKNKTPIRSYGRLK